MLPRLLRHLRFVKDLTTQHRLLGRHSFQTHAVSRAQIDLYHDVTPFDGGVPREVISFPPPRQTQHEDPSTPFPSLLLPTRKRLSQSNISVSFFLIDKRPGELTDRMALLLSKTFSYKAFLIASSGSLDIMASGLVLFTCGYGLGFLDAFDRLPCTYRGVLKLGQTSESYDLKMPIDRHRPWKHVTEAQVQKAAKEFVGDILLPPAPIHAFRSKDPQMLFKLKETEDMCVRPLPSLAALSDAVARSAKPATVYAFDMHYPSTPSQEIPFELVCDCVVEPASLIHAFGEKLGCDALLCDLQRVAIGEYTTEQAWSFARIFSAFGRASRGSIFQPDKLRRFRLMHSGVRYTKRVFGCNWHREFTPVKKKKILPYEKRRRKREREFMEREGLISEEDIMKRRLKKKAVKLVANMNVTTVEEVYQRILEE